MTTLQIKKKVHDLVENADERLLKMVYALMKEYKTSVYEFPEYELTAEDKKEVYRRSKELSTGQVKGISLDEVVKYARSAIKK